MKSHQVMSLIMLTCYLYSNAPGLAAPPPTVRANGGKNEFVPSSTKLFGSVDEINFAFRSAGITIGAERRIDNVRMGSPAYYAGVAEDDKIIKGQLDQQGLRLWIERRGSLFHVKLAVQPVDLTRAIPINDKLLATIKTKKLPATVEAKYADIFHYNVVICIDTSGSMSDRIESLNTTKWDWCDQFVSTFAADAQLEAGNRQLSIASFNQEFTLAGGQTPAQIANFFKANQPGGATNLGSPLEHIFATRLKDPKRKPLLVVIISDGMSNTGPHVESVIAEATNAIANADELKVAFLEVGEDSLSTAYLKYLDECLINEGAKLDVVETVSFEGLKKAKFLDVLHHIITAKPTKSKTEATSIDLDIAKIKADMELLRTKQSKNK